MFVHSTSDMATTGKVITCKAAVVWEINTKFSIETIEVQPPGYGEVRVKMHATGLCHTDLAVMGGDVPHPVPFVGGHEGAGIVESIGEGVTSVQPGDKVFSVCIPHCRRCRVCKTTRGNLCLDLGRKAEVPLGLDFRTSGYADDQPRYSCKGQTVHISTGTSSFSQYSVIPENSCVKVNPKTPLEKACTLACGVTTGYGASANAVEVRPGDVTAVWGIGGVGLATVLGCRDKGATTIIGIDINPKKEAIGRKMGCTHFLCPKDLTKPIPEVIKEMTKGGLDFAFTCVGIPQVMEDAVMSTRPGGSTVLVGLSHMAGTITLSPLYLLEGRKIIGTILGNYKILDDIPKLVDRYMEGKMPIDDFVTGYYSLEEINDAVEVMKAGQSIRSVILMT